jgi:hypothetical protein
MKRENIFSCRVLQKTACREQRLVKRAEAVVAWLLLGSLALGRRLRMLEKYLSNG